MSGFDTIESMGLKNLPNIFSKASRKTESTAATNSRQSSLGANSVYWFALAFSSSFLRSLFSRFCCSLVKARTTSKVMLLHPRTSSSSSCRIATRESLFWIFEKASPKFRFCSTYPKNFTSFGRSNACLTWKKKLVPVSGSFRPTDSFPFPQTSEDNFSLCIFSISEHLLSITSADRTVYQTFPTLVLTNDGPIAFISSLSST
mmetsp:Transcript_21091/g.31303  ORF Transcript_21091/g.31303 Transcript_21091/m.31303 type:complete len:203 (-) Transcript_21091:547-1155(-)